MRYNNFWIWVGWGVLGIIFGVMMLIEWLREKQNKNEI